MRFSRLRWLGIALIGAVAVGYSSSMGQPAQADSSNPDLEKMAAMADDPADGELRRLVKARFNAALLETKYNYSAFQLGRATQQSLADSLMRTVDSGLAAFEKREDRIALLERTLGFAKAVENSETAHQQAGIGTPAAAARARYARLDIEIRLLKLKAAQ